MTCVASATRRVALVLSCPIHGVFLPELLQQQEIDNDDDVGVDVDVDEMTSPWK